MNKQHHRCATTIIQILRTKAADAQARYVTAAAEKAGVAASEYAWDQMNPDDGVGGMGMNPYKSDKADKREVDARLFMENMQQVFDYAVDTFLDGEKP